MDRRHRSEATSSACAPQEFNTRCQYYGDALSYITQYAFKNPKSPFLVHSRHHTKAHAHLTLSPSYSETPKNLDFTLL